MEGRINERLHDHRRSPLSLSLCNSCVETVLTTMLSRQSSCRSSSVKPAVASSDSPIIDDGARHCHYIVETTEVSFCESWPEPHHEMGTTHNRIWCASHLSWFIQVIITIVTIVIVDLPSNTAVDGTIMVASSLIR